MLDKSRVLQTTDTEEHHYSLCEKILKDPIEFKGCLDQEQEETLRIASGRGHEVAIIPKGENASPDLRVQAIGGG